MTDVATVRHRWFADEGENGEIRLLMEPVSHTELQPLAEGYVWFSLRGGATLGDARQLADMLNRLLDTSHFTPFLNLIPDPSRLMGAMRPVR